MPFTTHKNRAVALDDVVEVALYQPDMSIFQRLGFSLATLFGVTLLLVTTIQMSEAQETQSPQEIANQALQQGKFGKALTIYRRFAYTGQAWAQYQIGLMYLRGNGVQASPVIAVDWIRQAADQGLPLASYELARMFCQTDSASGVVPGKCRENLQIAADRGVRGAMVDLARVHLRGQLGLGNFSTAKSLLSAAAEAGAQNTAELSQEVEQKLAEYDQYVTTLDAESIAGRFVRSTHTIELGSFGSQQSLLSWLKDKELDRIYVYEVGGRLLVSHNYFRNESRANTEMAKLNRSLNLDSMNVREWKAIEASLNN